MRLNNLNCTMATGVMLLVLAAGAISAQAAPITVQFQASGFTDLGIGNSPPTDPVSGTIIYEAASTTASIESLTSIALTIHGHTYSIGEVGFITPYGTGQAIGGLVNGVDFVSSSTNDFAITWTGTLQPFEFYYASSSISYSVWVTENFDQFSITAPTDVPEPGILILLGISMFSLVGLKRWWKE